MENCTRAPGLPTPAAPEKPQPGGGALREGIQGILNTQDSHSVKGGGGGGRAPEHRALLEGYLRRMRSSLVRFARQLSQEPEELAHEAFTRLLDKQQEHLTGVDFASDHQISSRLISEMRSLARREWRRKRRLVYDDVAEDRLSVPSPESQVMAREELARVREAAGARGLEALLKGTTDDAPLDNAARGRRTRARHRLRAESLAA